MEYIDLITASEETNVPKDRIENMIKSGDLNGVLVTDGMKVITGMISREELETIK